MSGFLTVLLWYSLSVVQSFSGVVILFYCDALELQLYSRLFL